jgi:hypothetical protein
MVKSARAASTISLVVADVDGTLLTREAKRAQRPVGLPSEQKT